MSPKILGPLLIALAALAAVLATIAPDGNGPGVTCDESYHVFQGKRLVTALRQQGPAFFLPENIERNFDWPLDGSPVQAPLGYWILGWTNYLFDPAPDDPLVFSIPAARFAPAVAFALLILMVGTWTSRREGVLAGTVAAAAVALTPRLFGHAHFAALDMPTTLFFVAAVLAVAEASRSGKTWHFALAGVVWGAAMLVRLHGLLLAPPVIVWLIWRLRRRSVWPLSAWFAAGTATLFVGWPWLWLDPVGRFVQYLASGPDRMSLQVFYWGQIWADRDVPWHYPWVMFAVTVPLGLLLLGMLGLWSECVAGRIACRGTHDTQRASLPVAREDFHRNGDCGLIAGTMFFLLLLFSWTGVPVYDGVRLFLMVFPLWAIWVGIGARWLTDRLISAWKTPRVIFAAIGAFVAIQGIGLVIYHPCHLSYYNLLTGGLAGANKLGFEATYWGDSVREPLLAEGVRLSDGSPILFAPNLAPFQAPAVEMYSPSLNKAGVELVGENQFEPELADRCRYAVIYNRRANPASVVGRGKVVAEYREQGVWLARLIELTAPLDEPSQ